MGTGLHSFALVLVAVVGCQTTHAARLILPQQVDASLRLELDSEPVDTNPADFLQVFVGRSSHCCVAKTPMAGRYRVERRTIEFDPAFSFIEDQPYTVLLNAGQFGASGTSIADIDIQGMAVSDDSRGLYDFVIATAGRDAMPAVVGIYPSGKQLPENTLRFYLHFSTPMQPHVSADFIQLQDQNGNEITDAFMAFKQELWSEDRKRLTLLMDPGRIKRGVVQNRTMGPALVEGSYYSIAIRKGWPSANGIQVSAAFEKRFLVIGALRARPNTDDWQIIVPRVSTREPLMLMFDRAFDSVLLQSAFYVLNAEGEIITGAVRSGSGERSWQFIPEFPWRNEAILLAVKNQFEDVAGNNFIELLDHAVQSSDQKTAQPLEHKFISIILKPAAG